MLDMKPVGRGIPNTLKIDVQSGITGQASKGPAVDALTSQLSVYDPVESGSTQSGRFRFSYFRRELPAETAANPVIRAIKKPQKICQRGAFPSEVESCGTQSSRNS